MSMMEEMGFELTPEECLKEIRNYPKIARAEVFGAEKEVLVLETAPMYLYTDDRSVRTCMGVFTITLYPDRVMMKNSTPIDEKGKWRNETIKMQSSTTVSGTSWDTMHHPHIPGSYVSLAAHETPLLEAIVKQDWIAATNTVIQFLEAYKFGEKAKKFFERQMEVKNEKTKSWEVVEFDKDYFQAGDLAGSYTYSGSSWTSEPDKEVKEIAKKAPKGSKVKLAWTNVTHGAPPEGTYGIIEGFTKTSVKVKWDNGSHFAVLPHSGDEIEIVEVPEGHDPTKEPDKSVFESSTGYNSYNYSNETYAVREKARSQTPIGCKIRIVKPADFHADALPAGSIGKVDKTFGHHFDVQWDDGNLHSILDPVEDIYDIIAYPEGYLVPGTRVKLTKVPDWDSVMKVGLEATVVVEKPYVIEVDWAEPGAHDERAITKSNCEWEVISTPDKVDLPKRVGDKKLEGEDKVDSRPPIQEFSATSGSKVLTSGNDTAPDDDDLWIAPYS